jgi:hypothetical protein
MTHEERWEVVKSALVEQAMRKKLDKGQIFRDEEKVARLVEGDIEAQAHRRPHWKQEQIDKHFGGTRRPTSKPSCPHCDLVFNADDQEAARGDDGLLYCRQSCAARIPFATFAETCAMHPEWAASLAFAADAIARRGATTGLASIHPPLEPAGADLQW